MNPETSAEAVRLAKAEDLSGIIVAPPFVFLNAVKKAVKKVALAAQDVFWAAPKRRASPSEAGRETAYTGEISINQLKQLGVKYAIVGHSERRRWLKETDMIINYKLKTVLAAGLKAVLCIGEDWLIRKKGLKAARSFVKKQLTEDLAGLQGARFDKLIIAYEPVWAIGTGRNDKPENASVMAEFIKDLLVKSYKSKVKVLYGGSVNNRNAGHFLKQTTIDGLLVGGASLKSGEFRKIVKLADS